MTKENQERFERLCLQLQTPNYMGFQSSTLPFFAKKGERLVLFGSSVLFQLADHSFLITAAHVMDKALEAARHGYLFFIHGGADNQLLPLNKLAVLRTPKGLLGRESDPFDLAVLCLPSDLTETLSLHRRFLHMPDIDPLDQQSPDSGYAIFGYPKAGLSEDPGSKSKSIEAMLYFTLLCQRDVGELAIPHDPRKDYLLNFSQQYSAATDGGSGGLKDPEGISGCGIWRIISDAAESDHWKPEDVRLVGIEHGWKDKKHYCRGTRIGIAIQMIVQRFPELRRIVDISRPAHV